MQRPAEWWRKAAFYWEKSQTVEDPHLRGRYIDLAARYLELAQTFEDMATATAMPNARQRSK